MAVDKLVDSAQLDADLATVANAIRAKGGTSGSLAFPAGFASAIAAIPTGGGGVQNCIIGEFTGTSKGAALSIDLPYTGSGYPIAIVVFPKEGAYNSSGTFYNKVQRYAINTFTAVKQGTEVPDWSSSGTQASVLYCYKSSSSTATNTTRTGAFNVKTFIAPGTATSTASNVVRMGSPTDLSVFIANTSYGFAADIPYIYIVAYSS